MEEKKKGISPILIVILSTIGTFLIIFGIYSGVNHFKGEEKTNNRGGESSEPSNNSDTPINSIPTGQVGEKIDFPQKADNNFIYIGEFFNILNLENIGKNFKNLKKEVKENTLLYNCEKYITSDEACEEIKLTINNDISIKGYFSTGIGDPSAEIHIYKFNSYYILFEHTVEGGWDNSILHVYKGSKQLLSKVVISEYWIEDGNDSNDNFINVKPIVANNTLHFVSSSSEGNYVTLQYYTVDLSKDDIETKLIKEFKGYYSNPGYGL